MISGDRDPNQVYRPNDVGRVEMVIETAFGVELRVTTVEKLVIETLG